MSTMFPYIEDSRSEEEKDREYFEKYWPDEDWKLSTPALLIFMAVTVWMMAGLGLFRSNADGYFGVLIGAMSLYATYEVARYLHSHPVN